MANKDIRKEKDSGNRKPSPQSKKVCLECGDRKAPSYTAVCGCCYKAHAGIKQGRSGAPSSFCYAAAAALQSENWVHIMARRNKRNNVQ